jgi:outer membrane protein
MRSPSTAALVLLGTVTAQAQPELHLDEAVQTALRNQPQILQATANVNAAVGRREQARAALLPQLNGTASASRVHGSSFTVSTIGTPVDPSTQAPNVVGSAPVASGRSNATSNRFVVGVGASAVLWDLGAIELLRAAHRSVDAERAQQKATQLQVVLAVRTAFFAARAQRDLIAVARENVENTLLHQRQIEGFVRAGTNPQIDLARVVTDVANAQVQSLNAGNAGLLAQARLHQAMGVGRDPREVADDQLPAAADEDAPLDALVQEALENRPELKSLMLQREAQAFNVAAARADFVPVVSASGSVSEVGDALNDLGPTWSFGATLSWRIFQGGLTLGQIHEAEAGAQSLLAQHQLEQFQVQLEVESAQLNLKAGKSVLEASNRVVTQAQVLLRLAERRYEVGLGNVIELSDAQISYTTARAQQVQAQFNLSTARAQLLAALGRTR